MLIELGFKGPPGLLDKCICLLDVVKEMLDARLVVMGFIELAIVDWKTVDGTHLSGRLWFKSVHQQKLVPIFDPPFHFDEIHGVVDFAD
jgi:hypothetical protein